MRVDGGFDGESLEFVDLILNLWQLEHFGELCGVYDRCVTITPYQYV